MEEPPATVFNCIEVHQPIGEFYIGVIDSKDLVKIAYADVRRILRGEERDVEIFSGIQRPLSPDRVKELQQYVHTVDAAFPTSIILHVDSDNAEYESGKRVMRIRRDENVAKIIDGQHRIAGLTDYKGEEPFQLNVTVFVDMDMESQALLFATINLKQTKVNKSLAYDLYEFATTRSPQKSCHHIARLANSREDSPFYHKIKLLGRATWGRDETLTQATFVEQLMKYITINAMRDRDVIKRGDIPELPGLAEQRKLPFRKMFLEDRDAEIAKNIFNYFHAVARRWPDAWAQKKREYILNRTTGFIALMRFMHPVYLSFSRLDSIVAADEYFVIFSRIEIDEDTLTTENYNRGSGGEAKLYRDLVTQSGLSTAPAVG